MLDPVCEDCGGTLRAVEAGDLDRVRTEDAEVPHVPGVSKDATGVFAALVTVPWLLPLIGVQLGDVVFAIPMVLLAFATHRALAASVASPNGAGSGAAWRRRVAPRAPPRSSRSSRPSRPTASASTPSTSG